MQSRIAKHGDIPDAPFKPISGLIPMSDLDLMIANGWGLTPRDKIPADWRTRHKPTTR